jgi:UDP-N-acetylglucosamine transferase subunit ALG13
MAASCYAQWATLLGDCVVIFVTVGHMPFDRLIGAVDDWAYQRQRSDVFAQIGPSTYRSKAITTVQVMDPLEFLKRIEDASTIVAHAGMGTIITALEYGKPIVVMPRRGHLRETRNDHQVATAKQFATSGRVIAAYNEDELRDRLDHLSNLESPQRIATHASPALIEAVRNFIESA